LLFALGWMGSPTAAQDGATIDWSGQWETRWRDGGARLILEQDGRSFMGRFDSGEWWTGARAATGLVDAVPADQSSPTATMRSFLTASNQAADGNLEALGPGAALVRPSDGSDDPIALFEHARALHAVIDLTTFRIWDLPHEGEDDGDAVSVVLEQAGTGERVTIPFRRIDGMWFIVPPPVKLLADIADRMRAAREEATADRTAGPGPQSTREAMRDFLLGFRYVPDGSAAQTFATLDLRGRPEITRDHDGQLLAGYLKRVGGLR
jgi:hypothetical protein